MRAGLFKFTERPGLLVRGVCSESSRCLPAGRAYARVRSRSHQRARLPQAPGARARPPHRDPMRPRRGRRPPARSPSRPEAVSRPRGVPPARARAPSRRGGRGLSGPAGRRRPEGSGEPVPDASDSDDRNLMVQRKQSNCQCAIVIARKSATDAFIGLQDASARIRTYHVPWKHGQTLEMTSLIRRIHQVS